MATNYPPGESAKYEYPCQTADNQPVKPASAAKTVMPAKIRSDKSTTTAPGRGRRKSETRAGIGNLSAAQNPAAIDKPTEAKPANSDAHHGHFSSACTAW